MDDPLTALVLASREESEEDARDTGEVCSFCEGTGIVVYEGFLHQPCVSCAPMAYCDWRDADYPNLRSTPGNETCG